MVKLNSKQREKDLKNMLINGNLIGLSLPLMKIEYNKIKNKKLNGNKNLFQF